MKTLIAYKTRYGSTKKYAGWLGKDLKCKVLEMDLVKDFSNFDHLIVMSGTYAGQMPLTRFLKINWDKVKNKQITIVAVGMAPEDSWWSKVTYFFMPGKIKRKAKYFKIKGTMPEAEPIKKSELKRVKDYLKKK